MSVYVDSGVLIQLYIREPNSAAAAAIIQELPSVPLTSLHELEIRSTFRALVGGGAISAGQRTASEPMFDVDILADRRQATVAERVVLPTQLIE